MAEREKVRSSQHLHRMKKGAATEKKKERDIARANTPPPSRAQHDISKAMPFSNDAEKGVLSCFFHKPEELLPDAQRTIPEAAFYHTANRLLFQTAMLFYRWSKPFEYIALSDYLQSKGLMEKIGGQGMLAELLDFVPTPAHYSYYKGIILDNYLLRQGIGISTEHIQNAYEHQQGGGGLDEWTKKFAADALELRQQFIQGPAGRDGVSLDVAHDEMVQTAYEKGPSSGIKWFDKVFGGLVNTRLILVHGRRAIGKSSLVRQIGWHAAKHAIPTEMITVEMSRAQYYQGICCLEGVGGNSFLKAEFMKEELAIMEKLKRSKAPLKLHDDIRTLDECISRMETASLKRGAKLFIVDMPQRLMGDKSNGREQELSGIFWAMKDAARRLNGVVLAPVHMNAQLIARGSEDIENHADQILILAAGKEKPTALDKWSKRILAQVTKNRFGPDGGKCLFDFVGEQMMFHETDEDTAELGIEPAEESRPKRGK